MIGHGPVRTLLRRVLRRAPERPAREQVAERLPEVTESIRAEIRLPPGDRATGAADPSLHDAVDHAGEAWRRLTDSEDAEAALALHRLLEEASDWSPDAPLTESLRSLGPPADRLAAAEPPVPLPESFPSVLALLQAGDAPAASTEYQERTGAGPQEAQAAVEAACRRLGLPGSGR